MMMSVKKIYNFGIIYWNKGAVIRRGIQMN